MSPDAVEREVAANRDAVGFEVGNAAAALAFAPHLDERVLRKVFRLLPVPGDAQPHAEYFILHGEQVLAEVDVVHWEALYWVDD